MVSFYFISGQIFVLSWGGKQGGRREGGWGAEEGLMRKWLQGSTGQRLNRPAGLRRGPGEGQQTHFLAGLPQAGKVSL